MLICRSVISQLLCYVIDCFIRSSIFITCLIVVAHGLTADAVASHAFYGTEAVVHALQPFAGYAQGHVTIRMGGVERDRCTGLVCGFNVAYEVDDAAAAAAAMLSSRVGLAAAL